MYNDDEKNHHENKEDGTECESCQNKERGLYKKNMTEKMKEGN